MNAPGKFLLVGLLALASCAALDRDASTERPASFTLYLVRHAEKTHDGKDPALSESGRRRADWTADWAMDKGLARIWSSDYRRSRDTAQPAAERLGLSVELYDPTDLEGLARRLLDRAETALVVGHSNTTPELAALLCECRVNDMSDEDYDRLLAVTVEPGRRSLFEFSQRALQSAPAGD